MPFFTRMFIKLSLVLSLSVLFSGCCCLSGAMNSAQQAAEKTKMKNNLTMLAMSYHNYHDMHRKGPADWDELSTMAEAGSPWVQEVRSAGYQVAWGVSLSQATIGTSNFVLAHRPQDEATGGMVLMLDTSVKDMTATELADALKQRESMP